MIDEARMIRIGAEIALQLGGIERISIMVGAFDYILTGHGIGFKFRGSRKANWVEIEYNEGTDLYRMEFEKINLKSWDLVSHVETFDSVQSSELIRLFEETTGLRLRLS